MYVIPFSMGPVGGPLSKIGIQCTDSNYVLLCMRLMTRVSPKVLDLLQDDQDFVKCIHSMGCPRPVPSKFLKIYLFFSSNTLLSSFDFAWPSKGHKAPSLHFRSPIHPYLLFQLFILSINNNFHLYPMAK